MKERSLVERIVAILGVLLGTIAWVVRLLFSWVRGLLGGSESAGLGAGRDTSSAKPFAADVRERGESLKQDIAGAGQSVASVAREQLGHARDVAGDAVARAEEVTGDLRHKADEVKEDLRHKADELRHREGGEEAGTFETRRPDAPELRSVQHGDVGGVPEAPNFRPPGRVDATASAGATASGETGLSEGDFGTSHSSLIDDQAPEAGYAGQAVSESDIGMDRGEDGTELADSDEMPPPGAYDQMWVRDQITSMRSAELEEDEDQGEGDVPAASRGWDRDEVETDAPFERYGSTWIKDQIDYENDEVDEDDDAGMHIVDSPDEPYIEDDSAAQSVGLADEVGAPAFDADLDTEPGEQPAVHEDDFAADALGNRVGGDAASGDLGPAQSPDDATWEPGESRPDYDIESSSPGSGVDEFESDDIATGMLEGIGIEETETGTADFDEGPTGGTGSVAWATSAGVIEPELAKPLSPDELEGSGKEVASTEGNAQAGEPGLHEKDAGLLDVASDVSEQLGGASGTTMSGAGQSAGAMTSDDAVSEAEGSGEMTSNTGSFETGGTTAPEAGAGEDEADSKEGSPASSMGVGSNPQFNEVLPDQAYQESVGYESLQADRITPERSRGQGSGDVSAATTPARRGNAPAGAIRGDGSGVCPPEYPIKGNASSHIYHRPTDSSYEMTNPEFCFATEDDAKRAGFRPRKG